MVIGRSLVAIAMWAIIISGFAGHPVQRRQSQPTSCLLLQTTWGLDASPCYPEGSEKPAMPNLERPLQRRRGFRQLLLQRRCVHPPAPPSSPGVMVFATGVRVGGRPPQRRAFAGRNDTVSIPGCLCAGQIRARGHRQMAPVLCRNWWCGPSGARRGRQLFRADRGNARRLLSLAAHGQRRKRRWSDGYITSVLTGRSNQLD